MTTNETTTRLMCDWCDDDATVYITIDGWTDQACDHHEAAWSHLVPPTATVRPVQ